MAILKTENLTFSYPGGTPVLSDINLSVEPGEFMVLCGGTGSGKTTLLRQLKKETRPVGSLTGSVLFHGLSDTPDEEFYRIGMVFQDPDNQIVMDSVWHELAFSLESQGLDRLTMRKRIAEMARFFGIEPILEKSVHDLSGGEKQLVNLASVLLLRPEVLLLDEPVSQLDPVASEEFLHMVKRLNDEFSITIIMAEHNLQSLFSLADTIVLLESGSVKYQGCPQEVCRMLFQDINYRTFVPSSAQLYFSLQGEGQIPFTVKEAKTFMKGRQYRPERRKLCLDGPEILACSNITFRYEKDGQNVLENLSLSVHEGEILSLAGGNGAGKTTLFKILLGLLRPQRGTVKINGKKRGKQAESIGYLAQNPLLHFTCDTLYEDIYGYAKKIGVTDHTSVDSLVDSFGLAEQLQKHPYDLSGGQQQKAALITVLLKQPKILLLDEPTKGMDPASKDEFGQLLHNLREQGITIVMITHDIEFSQKVSDRCAMLFDKTITSIMDVYSFYQDNYFYTTVLNKILGGGS